MASLVILAISTVIYAIYASSAPSGPKGGSTIGLLFGSIGFGFMIFAGLLGARKRVPIWRLGRAQAWMRGHLWLGLLSLPLILFHGGFHFGGTLTRVLMWLLIITVGSGVFGAVLQHYVPRIMSTDVPLETIYAEIGNVRQLLREEADRDIEAVCGPMELEKGWQERRPEGGGIHGHASDVHNHCGIGRGGGGGGDRNRTAVRGRERATSTILPGRNAAVPKGSGNAGIAVF